MTNTLKTVAALRVSHGAIAFIGFTKEYSNCKGLQTQTDSIYAKTMYVNQSNFVHSLTKAVKVGAKN